MTTTNFREFPVDNASILFLSLIRPHHTNSFRFSAKLRSPIIPEVLQQAVNQIHARFPSVVAGFRRDFFHYRQIASAHPPVVQPDSSLLKPMTSAELRNCSLRVYYQDCTIAIEFFHALTDGSGAIVTLTTLVQEYLRLLPEQSMPAEKSLALLGEPLLHEVEDSYLNMAHVRPKALPTRFAYQLPRPADADWTIRGSSLSVDAKLLVDAAHRHNVTVNSLLTTVLASSAMELQIREKGYKSLKPVRIMAPVNLRKMIGSRTMRNFSLYTLPTMEGHHYSLSMKELCKVIGDQQKAQLAPDYMSALVSRNVRLQNSWIFRMLPWALKSTALRIGYAICGESNSSVTMSNLGIVRMPEELAPHVVDFQCWMTPRMGSPYVCTILSFGDKLTINVSRFCPTDELGEVFFRKIASLIAE